jgi:hypothetical protein
MAEDRCLVTTTDQKNKVERERERERGGRRTCNRVMVESWTAADAGVMCRYTFLMPCQLYQNQVLRGCT